MSPVVDEVDPRPVPQAAAADVVPCPSGVYTTAGTIDPSRTRKTAPRSVGCRRWRVPARKLGAPLAPVTSLPPKPKPRGKGAPARATKTKKHR